MEAEMVCAYALVFWSILKTRNSVAREKDGNTLAHALQFHISNSGLWFRDRLAILQQSLQMERDSFTDIPFDLFSGLARCDASRYLRNVGGKIVFAL